MEEEDDLSDSDAETPENALSDPPRSEAVSRELEESEEDDNLSDSDDSYVSDIQNLSPTLIRENDDQKQTDKNIDNHEGTLNSGI